MRHGWSAVRWWPASWSWAVAAGACAAACGSGQAQGPGKEPAAIVASAATSATADSAGAEISAPPDETRACEGPTAIPPEIDEMLSAEGAPERDHCELHRLVPGEPPLLFVRTMNTVAHDDEGRPLPACSWRVFHLQPSASAGSLHDCRFRIEKGCVTSLDEENGTLGQRTCMGPDGKLVAE